MYRDYLVQLQESLNQTKFYSGDQVIDDWQEAFTKIMSCFFETKKTGHQLFFIGNGGSSAIASHMTADFMKNGGMRTVSLYDNALTTCMGNDYGYQYVFSKPLSFLGNRDDLLVAISSSGNSKNIVNAINTAKEKGMLVVTFSGFKPDNLIKSMGDYNIYVPLEHYGIVESIHNMLLQQVVDEIMKVDGVEL